MEYDISGLDSVAHFKWINCLLSGALVRCECKSKHQGTIVYLKKDGTTYMFRNC